MATATVNGIRLHYQWRDGGGDRPVVFVHGVAANLAFWHLTVAPLLPPASPILTYDLRGHGRSEMPPAGYTSADMADDLSGLLDHLQISGIDLVGHSFGGAIALHFVVQHPERVHTLVLADARIPCLQPWAAIGPDRGGLASGVDIPFAPAARPGRAAHLWRRLLESTTAGEDLGRVAGLTPDRIASTRPPAMLIYGERSHCGPTLDGLRRHLRPRRVEIVAGAGHFHPVDQPVRFAQDIRAFASECR